MPYPLKDGKDAWQYQAVPDFLGGLNSNIRSDLLEDNELITARNVFIEKRSILSETGYRDFGEAVRGTPQDSYQFFTKAGVSSLFLITTDTFYVWNQDEWQYATSEVNTTTTATSAATDVTITVTDITGFADNDYIGIILDDGTQHRTRVNGAPAGSTITFDDAIPAGRSVAIGAAVVKALVLAGTVDKQISACDVPSHDWFVFTNGVDTVKRWDGTDVRTVPNLPSGGNTICRAVALFNNSLFLLNTTEGGTAHPQRVRRSNSADPTDWTTGTAGFDDLYDASDYILGSLPLGPYLIVYRERSIHRGEYVGTGGINYSFPRTVLGEGIIATKAIADIGDYHIIFGNANAYIYRGGFEIEPIGDKIYYKIYGTKGELNPSQKNKCFALYVEETDEVFFFYPSTGHDNCDKFLRYSVSEEHWFERTLSDEMVGFGFYVQEASREWNDLEGDWSAQTWDWGSRTVLENSPTTLLCPASGSAVFEYDYINSLDDDAAIAYIVETKDFILPSEDCRFDMLEFIAAGDTILVEYSTDRGGSYEILGTFTRGTLGKERMFAQFLFSRIRFRFSGSTTGFRLDGIGFSYKLESI